MKKNNLFYFIFIFLCLQIQCFASTIKFAQISDLHYQSNVLCKSINYYALPIIDDVAEALNNERDIKFVLITGDIINKRKYEDAKFIYKHFNEIFKMPWYSVFGNHDLGGRILFKIRLINLLKEINLLFKSIAKDYYSFRPVQDILFIGLNSNYTFKRTPLGYISKKQLRFLNESLEKADRNDVVVIFMHHTPIKFPLVHKNHYIVNEQKLMDILKNFNNPILLLGGHYHSCKIEQEGNIIKVATPSLASFPLEYRVIQIINDDEKTIFDIKSKSVCSQLQKMIMENLNVGKCKVCDCREIDKNLQIKIKKI